MIRRDVYKRQDKEYVATPMTKEMDRCRMAVDLAAEDVYKRQMLRLMKILFLIFRLSDCMSTRDSS